MTAAFRLESPPAVEPRHRRALREVVAQIRDAHADRDRVADREADNAEFRQRAFLIMSGEELVAFRDPLDGAELNEVLDGLADRFRGLGVPYWKGRDLCVSRAGRIVATITGDDAGEPVLTRFDRGAAPARAATGPGPAPALSQWIDPDDAAELVGGPDVLEMIGERLDLSVRLHYLREEIVALARQPKPSEPTRRRGGPTMPVSTRRREQ